ncbi:hypothetical protein M1E08_09730 [Erwinia sp. PK3-005]
MSEKTIGRIGSLLTNYSERLHSHTAMFHDNIVRYWNSHRDIHSFLEIKSDEDGNITGELRDFNFYFLTTNRLVLSEDEILSEVNFYTEVDGKRLSILKCFIHYTREFTFDTAMSDDLLDIDYDDSIERKVLNRLISAAYEKKLISAD